MDLYIIYMDKKKHSQYKNYESAYKIVEEIIDIQPNSIININLEQYCEYGHSDISCKHYLLYTYDNGKINKYFT